MTSGGPGALRPPNVWPDSSSIWIQQEMKPTSEGTDKWEGGCSDLKGHVPSASECHLPWNDAHGGSHRDCLDTGCSAQPWGSRVLTTVGPQLWASPASSAALLTVLYCSDTDIQCPPLLYLPLYITYLATLCPELPRLFWRFNINATQRTNIQY